MKKVRSGPKSLSDPEQDFVLDFVGYQDKEIIRSETALLRSPQVLAAIQQETRRVLVIEAPAALQRLITLSKLADSEKVRADCNKDLLNRAGLVGPRAAAAGASDKPLHELAVVELRAMADRLQGEIEARAKPVNAPNAPNAPAADPQVSDLTG